jgi:glycerol uptake facilitator-like aquaporin
VAEVTEPTDTESAAARHYLLRFEVDTLRSRPLWVRVIIEFLGTFLLICVAAGAGVINHYVGGNPISGASMNPARSLGPDIVSTDFTGWWVYVAGPVIGARIAVVIIGLVRGLPDRQEQAAAEGDVRR